MLTLLARALVVALTSPQVQDIVLQLVTRANRHQLEEIKAAIEGLRQEIEERFDDLEGRVKRLESILGDLPDPPPLPEK